MPSRPRIALFGLMMVVLASCSGSPETTTTTGETTTTTSTTTSTTTTVPGTEADVQDEIDWFVGILNGDELTASEYEARFSDEFRQQVSYEAIQPILEQFRPSAPFSVVDRSGEGSSGEAVIESTTGDRARILAEIDDEMRFTTLLIQPTEAPALEDPPDTVVDAFARLAEIGEVRALTAEVVDGSCDVLDSVGVEEPTPVGSVFKLYVLAAVGEAVATGELAWDDSFTIEEELKSIPTGELQNRDAGSEVTILEAARLMISISDNTAADHLIDLLGREVVETIQARYGNTTPELNTPFLSTREFAALKVGPASGLRNPQWIEGDEGERRSILDQISDITPEDIPVQDWIDPVDPDLVEWFASPQDLCDLAIGLIDLADSVPEVAQILEINPGIPAEAGVWDRIWFKGGSEPGLLATWWVTRVEGRTFVTAGSVVNADQTIDSDRAVLLFAAARDLLAP